MLFGQDDQEVTAFASIHLGSGWDLDLELLRSDSVEDCASDSALNLSLGRLDLQSSSLAILARALTLSIDQPNTTGRHRGV